MSMITFQPDPVDPASTEHIETALFLGVRGDPPLESTQLRWQVRLSTGDAVQLETGQSLATLGGALFLTTKEPKPEVASDEEPPPIGWLRWIADAGRRSFQIQLAISRMGFDRISQLALSGRYPHAILTFKDDGSLDVGGDSELPVKTWNNVASKVALIDEYTFRYDLAGTAR